MLEFAHAESDHVEAARVEKVHSEQADHASEWAKGTLLADREDRKGALDSFQHPSRSTDPHHRGELVPEYGRFLKNTGNPTQARKALPQAVKDLGSSSTALGRSALAELESLEVPIQQGRHGA